MRIKSHAERSQQEAMNFIILLNNELLDLKDEKKKLLKLQASILKTGLRFSQENIMLACETSIHMLDTKIQKLQRAIAKRFKYLLSWDQPRIFCEAYKQNGEYNVNQASITLEPINQLGTEDLNRGFIKLNRIKNNTVRNTLQISTVVINLRNGTLYEQHF